MEEKLKRLSIAIDSIKRPTMKHSSWYKTHTRKTIGHIREFHFPKRDSNPLAETEVKALEEVEVEKELEVEIKALAAKDGQGLEVGREKYRSKFESVASMIN